MKLWEECDCRFSEQMCEFTYAVDGKDYVYKTKAKCMEQAITNLFYEPDFKHTEGIHIKEFKFIFPQN